jgi:large subunit ribosomal protein L4
MPSKALKPKKEAKVKKIVKPVVKKAAVKKVVKAKVEAKIAVSKPSQTTSLNASVFDMDGKIAGHVGLPSGIFGAKINNALMSQAVRVYLINQRQGTSKTKHRGEVDRTTKKIYQQKGTGQARHGSRRAPIYVGGGKVFGPTPRDLSLNISKKMKTLALFSALSSKLKDNEIKIVKGLEAITPKTKLMVKVLGNLKVNNGLKVLLVMPKAGKETENVYRASRNIEGLEILSANLLNTYKVLDNKLILLMKDAIDSLENTFVKQK